MSGLVITLSRAETFVLTWGVRLVGVLGVTLALVWLGWQCIERILRWAHVYSHFRKWYLDKCVTQARAENEARAQKEYEARRAAEARGERPASAPIFGDDADVD